MTTTKKECVNGTPFLYELEGDHLSVFHVRHDDDHCAGQHQVLSALYRVMGELNMEAVGMVQHSGGWAGCTVKPLPVDEE